ncbi:MAG: carboxypeptidase-like regulatory domain-containing protein [Planctomycetota bacterium]|nr:carboxypeptidase-like regulatory domain-containing protein [Planctomycetota bacterium]
MRNQIKLILTTLVLLTCAVAWWMASTTQTDGGSRTVELGPTMGEMELGTTETLSAPSQAPARREVELLTAPGLAQGVAAEATTAPDLTEEVASEATTVTVRGIVVDVEGRAIEGVKLTVSPADVAAKLESDAFGKFELQLETLPSDPPRLERAHSVTVKDDAWFGLRTTVISSTSLGDEHVIVAVPVRELELLVVDTDGMPIAGASVTLGLRQTLFHGFPYSLAQSVKRTLSAGGDDRGRVRFDRFPSARGLSIEVQAKGYLTASLWSEDVQGQTVVELLRRDRHGGDRVTGYVMDADGSPILGATVRLHYSEARTDQAGFFEMPVAYMEPSSVLSAGCKGYLAAQVDDFGAIFKAAEGRLDPVQLVLGGEPVEIRGKVLDAQGDPLKGWRVRATDEQVLSVGMSPPVTAESLARGGTGISSLTDAEGCFVITSLFPREYALEALDENSLLAAVGSGFGGGDDVVLRCDQGLVGPLQGEVVNRHGMYVPGVGVTLARSMHQGDSGRTWISGDSTVTDEQGRFRLAEFPPVGVHLRLHSKSIESRVFELEEAWNDEVLRIEVVLSCQARIEVLDPALASRVTFLSDRGEPLMATTRSGNGSSSSTLIRLVEGRSEPITVPETATEVVLYLDGKEVGRQPVTLDPAQLTVLRL